MELESPFSANGASLSSYNLSPIDTGTVGHSANRQIANEISYGSEIVMTEWEKNSCETKPKAKNYI